MKHCLGCMELYGEEFKVCPYCGYIEGTPAEEKIHMEPGTLLHNRYIIGKVLGYGGFGVTYIGWDGKLEQKVAIKEYLPGEFSTRMPGQSAITIFSGDKSEQFLAGMKRFVEEAKRLAKFKNESGIVKILDSFEENSTAYIIMEYLDGETLTAFLERNNTMKEDDAIKLLTPVMRSLQTVHGEGILHRDIAPDNIFLTKTGEVKLIDFGASRYATTSHSRSLTVIIKPGFSAEEQYRSRGDQGPHTDVYSLGATLYKMITGKTPPDAMERRAKYENQNRDILVPPHVILKRDKVKPNISPDRENAILNAMNVRIEDRTPDVGTLLNELNSDKPVKRKQGKIKRIDLYGWPLWLKIALPAILGVFVILGTLLLTGVIKLGKYKTEIILPDNTVIVPDVEGKTAEDAIAVLEGVSLGANITSKEYEFQPAGTIVVQEPLQGSYAMVNSDVKLIVSKGKGAQEAVDGISTVPHLVGSTKEDALKDIETAGLAVGEIKEDYSDNYDAGLVISQSIESETKVNEGTEISITVSLGKQSFDMPDAVGKGMNEAKAQLEQLGLRVTFEQKPDKAPVGQVIGQSVSNGSQVKKGDLITLTVSSGEAETKKVPNVAGASEEAAAKTLKDAGFTVEVKQQYSNDVQKGYVISQNPGADSMQAAGTQITIIVSMGRNQEDVTQPPATEPPATQKIAIANVVGKTQSEAERTLKNQGFAVSVNEAYSSKVTAGVVISQNPSAGASVEKGSRITITVSKGTEKISVPDVVGKNSADARSTLEGKGFTVTVSEEYNSTVAKGAVIWQVPSAGTMKEKGSTVSIAVSKGRQSVTVTLDPNGGKVSPTTVTVYPGEAYGSLPTPQRDYYTFAGWYTSDEGGNKITQNTTVPSSGDLIRTLYAHWTQNDLSDWVKFTEKPDGARVVEEKYTYTKRFYDKSSKSSLSGWTRYDKERTGWGSTQGPVSSDPSNGSRKVWSESVYDHTEYHYYRWTNGTDSWSYQYNNSYWLEERWFRDVLPVSQYGTAVGYEGSDIGRYVWIRADYAGNRDVDKTWSRSVNKTVWYYQEPVYTYYYYQDRNLESKEDPSGEADVSKVVYWVRFQAK